MSKLTSYLELLGHLSNDWFPLWAAYPDDTPDYSECLTVDWVCPRRVPDGKYFSTVSLVTQEEAAEFKRLASERWEQERVEFIGGFELPTEELKEPAPDDKEQSHE